MAYIQTTSVAGNSSTATATATFGSPVTAGSGLIVAIAQSGTGAGRTYTVSNGTDTFTLAATTSPSRAAHIYWCAESLGQFTTITATVNAGSAAFDLVAYEVAALDPGIAASTSTFAGTGPTHYCGASEGITTAGSAYIVTASALAANVSGHTKHASFDGGTVGTGNARYFQFWDAPSGVSLLRGEWTQTGTNANSTSAIAAFRFAVASSPPTSGGAGGRHFWFGR